MENNEIALPESSTWVADVKEKAINNMRNHDNCAQAILSAYMEVFEIDNPLLMRSAGAMMGGMCSSLTCGVHTSGMMVLGLLLGREKVEDGVDGLFPVVRPAQELIQRLNAQLGSSSCLEITGVDFTDCRQARKYSVSREKAQCIELVGTGAEEIGKFLCELEERGALFRVSPLPNTIVK